MENYFELLKFTQQKIKEKLRQEQRSEAWLARKLNIDPSNFAKKLKNYDIQDKMLAEICCILGENFFLYHYNYTEKKLANDKRRFKNLLCVNLRVLCGKKKTFINKFETLPSMVKNNHILW